MQMSSLAHMNLLHLVYTCYSTGIGHPVFDMIELTLYHKWIQQIVV